MIQEASTIQNEEQSVKPKEKVEEAQVDSIEEAKGEEMTQGPTKEKVS